MIQRFLKSPLSWLLLFQTLLVCIIFQQILFQPSRFYTNNTWDGIRTLFTIQTYVEQEAPNSWERFNYMNHPYGEEMVFAGGTPLFSYLLKLLHETEILPAAWVLPAYYWLILLSIPLTSLVTYLIIKSLLKKKWIACILGFTLPWINYQIPRLVVGHFDLSMSCFLLFNIWLLILITKNWNDFKKQIIHWGLYVFMLVILAYVHLYLAAIIAVFTAIFCVVIGWLNFNTTHGLKSKLIPTLSGGFFSGLAFAIIILIFNYTDPHAKERRAIPEGYNWEVWNAQFSSMFTPSHGEKIKFPLQSTASISYENDTYLGSFALYGILLLTLAWLVRKKSNLSFPSFKKISKGLEGKIIIAIFLSGLCSLLIAFGEEFYILKGEYIIKNYLNLFYWAKKIYPGIQQFRVLARFNFYFFWAANFLVAFLLVEVFLNKPYGKAIIIILISLSIIDLSDRIKFLKGHITEDNFINVQQNKIPNLNYSQYQAILPIPFYLVGNEDYNITIDPEDNWNTFTYYLSYHSKLPLMASKMPRTSLVQARAQISIFQEKTDSVLINKLKQTGKPVLIVYNPNLPRVSVPVERQPANMVNESFSKFLEREAPRLKKEIVHNGLEYFQWTPKE